MEKSIFKKLGGEYEQQRDYLIPCIALPAEEEQPIGIWGWASASGSSSEPTETAGETAASGLSEAVPKGYIHQSSHKQII